MNSNFAKTGKNFCETFQIFIWILLGVISLIARFLLTVANNLCGKCHILRITKSFKTSDQC